jgi:hypothetical protein
MTRSGTIHVDSLSSAAEAAKIAEGWREASGSKGWAAV